MPARYLIFNADDFGWSRDVNDGIIHAHTHGVLTSTTLMANGAAFDHAVQLAGENPTLGVGCHLVLVQGISVLTGKPYPDTPFRTALAIAAGRLNVYQELRAQIRKIAAAGIRMTHLDSHKHTHALPQVFRAVVQLAHEFDISWVRLPFGSSLSIIGKRYRALARRMEIAVPDTFLGFRLTGRLDEPSLLAALQNLPAGVTEFMCHPGFLREELRRSPTRLKDSRVRELEALTSPRVREFLTESGVRLGPFGAAARQ